MASWLHGFMAACGSNSPLPIRLEGLQGPRTLASAPLDGPLKRSGTMTFIEAVATCFSKYVTFSGRAPRAEFWLWFLFILLLVFIISLINTILFFGNHSPYGWSRIGVSIVFDFVSLVLGLPHLAVTARRLHDCDKSGWWCLFMFVPITGFFVLLYWLVTPSTPGSNRFGLPYSKGSEYADGLAAQP